jgi:hypothetical protein
MSSVDGPSVAPYLGRVAMEVFIPLGAIVVCIAQRLQLACHEQVPVALMWHNMVNHGCGCNDAIFHAHPAEWFTCKL